MRTESKVRLLLRSLKCNERTPATIVRLKRDIRGVEQSTIDEETITDYLKNLTSLFIIENQKPYTVAIRTSLGIKQAEKCLLIDPSLTCLLSGVTEHQRLFGVSTAPEGLLPPGIVITQDQPLRLKIACERFRSSSFWLARWRYTCSFISRYSSTFSFTGVKVSRRRIMWSIASCRFE